jgi:hypothetical protein
VAIDTTIRKAFHAANDATFAATYDAAVDATDHAGTVFRFF